MRFCCGKDFSLAFSAAKDAGIAQEPGFSAALRSDRRRAVLSATETSAAHWVKPASGGCGYDSEPNRRAKAAFCPAWSL